MHDMKSSKADKPVPKKKARRRAFVGQAQPVVGERPKKREPEDGFDLAVLSPKETGLPFVVYILEDRGVVPEVRVEVARRAGCVSSHPALKVCSRCPQRACM